MDAINNKKQKTNKQKIINMKRKWEHVFSSDFILKLYEYICFTGHRGHFVTYERFYKERNYEERKI